MTNPPEPWEAPLPGGVPRGRERGPHGVSLARCGDSFQSWRPELAPAMSDAVDACRELLSGQRRCVFLIGGVGNGKTHLAIATVREWGLSAASKKSVAMFYWSAEFWKVAELFNGLRALYADDGNRVEDTVQLYAHDIGLLVLDDLGVGQVTPWASEQVYRLIDGRYDANLATFVTSNSPLGDIDPRIVSRLREGLVICRAPDVRGKL